MRKVDLSEIAYETKNDKKIYLWNQSIGKEMHFEYDGKQGVLKILSCGRECITVLYEGKEVELFTRFVKQGRIAKIFEKEVNWKYDVGDIINDKVNSHTRNMTITKKKYIENTKDRRHKFYQYHCNICGYDCSMDDYWINETGLDNGKGCSCCAGTKVIRGINDIPTTAPWMVDYFVNEDDLYTHTENSNILLPMICPDCGQHKMNTPWRVKAQGFACDYCSDGISYPEKFMMNVFKQLGIDYIYQLTKYDFSWIKQYRYDFYIKEYHCIVEVHGMQHYRDAAFGKQLEDTVNNDNNKHQLAIDNGINKYIVLDCSKSEKDWIIKSIFFSELANLYDFNNVDFNQADIFGNKSILLEVCDYYTEHYPNITTQLMSEYFKISRTGITRYLNVGNKLGLCNYESVNAGAKERGNKNSKPIKIIDNNKIYYFRSIKLMKSLYSDLFNKNATDKCVHAVLKGDKEFYDNRKFEYCSKEEFNEQHENNLVYGEPFILSIL